MAGVGFWRTAASSSKNDDRNDRLLAKGGTMLGTARVQPRQTPGRPRQIMQTLDDNGIDVLIPIGGEGTLTAAHWLSEENVPVVGVPKTIDNDIDCTDVTFGHDTALGVASEAIDRLHSTAESHQRVMLVEVMGRHAGLDRVERGSGVRRPHDPDSRAAVRRRGSVPAGQTALRAWRLTLHLRRGRRRQTRRGLNAVAAGRNGRVRARAVHRGRPAAGLEVEKRINKEVRVTVLGHVQRGGTPTRTTGCWPPGSA